MGDEKSVPVGAPPDQPPRPAHLPDQIRGEKCRECWKPWPCHTGLARPWGAK
jgi:hypothetical protein